MFFYMYGKNARLGLMKSMHYSTASTNIKYAGKLLNLEAQ